MAVLRAKRADKTQQFVVLYDLLWLVNSDLDCTAWIFGAAPHTVSG